MVQRRESTQRRGGRGAATGSEPRLDPLQLGELETGDAARLFPGSDLDALRFEQLNTSGDTLDGVSFSDCELIDWSAHETALQGARFLQTRIEQAHAPIFSARRSTWRGVEISRSRLGAVEWYDAEFTQVRLSHAKLGWVNLRGAQLRDVIVEHCTIDELDLSGADLARVRFDDTRTDKLVLTGCRAQYLDLRGLEFREIEGIEGLRGAIVSHEQLAGLATVLAGHLGISVEG